MSQEPGAGQKRIDIPYFEGVNSLVGANIARKTELLHAENARSTSIGSIEKRAGQTVFGTDSSGGAPFVTTANYSIFRFQNDQNDNGFFRISSPSNPVISIPSVLIDPVTYNPPVETLMVSEVINVVIGASTSIPNILTVGVADYLDADDVVNNLPDGTATIYYITGSGQWAALTGAGTNIAGGDFTHIPAEGNLYLVNYNDYNRYILSDGVTVIDSTVGSGNFFNSPPAHIVNYYKQRLYLADFIQNGIRYATTILRSSYAMGVLSLVNSDTTGFTSTATIPVTDNRYFYTDSGANEYDIYRGNTLITTITVTTINETSVVATFSGQIDFLAADEIWIAGTYTGQKVFRWVNNPTVSGQVVKQYDTFKLSGGDDTEITMMINIGNVMIVANRFVMCSWNDYTLENFDLDVGCVSRHGYWKLLGTLYFIHYSGIYATSGSVPKLISSKVQRYIKGATRAGLEASVAGKKGTSVFFSIGQVTLYNQDGSLEKVLDDVCLEYNTIQQNWYVHTNVKVSDMETHVDLIDPDRMMMATTDGNRAVKEFLSGESDDGEEIPFRIDTQLLTLQSSYENLNNLIAVLADTYRGSSMKVFIDLDDGQGFYPIEGNIEKGYSRLKVTNRGDERGKPPVCRIVAVSLRDNSKQICKISRMSIIFVPTSADDPDNDNA